MVSIAEITVDAPRDGVVVDPLSWFYSPGSFELEVGCGKGGFLLSRARANPDVRLLGVEWANKYYLSCADRMARWGLTNVRVMRTDARTLILDHLPRRCVSVLHLYHPDPWPKRRHHKRRLVQRDFVDAAVGVLATRGRWLVQSDHYDYFQHIRRLLGERPDLTAIPWEASEAAPGSDWAGTNYEIKYARQGRPIYRAAYSLEPSELSWC